MKTCKQDFCQDPLSHLASHSIHLETQNVSDHYHKNVGWGEVRRKSGVSKESWEECQYNNDKGIKVHINFSKRGPGEHDYQDFPNKKLKD